MKSKRAVNKTHTKVFSSKVKPKVKPKTKVTKVKSAPAKKVSSEPESEEKKLSKRVLKSKLAKELLAEKASLEERLDAIDFTPSVTSGDTADLSVALADEKMKVIEQDRLLKKLTVVKMVLNRIETNENFAKCDDCGDDIELKRLLFIPTARRCVFCQQNFESK
jgi:RNA polymerase-binding transcription factor DksA